MATSRPGSKTLEASPSCPVCEREGSAFFVSADGRDYLRCRYCLATFLSPEQRPGRAAERSEYDLHRNDVDDPGYRRFLAALVEPLLERVADSAIGLDYGCGPGPALAVMVRASGRRMAVWDPIYQPDTVVLESTYDFVTCTEVVEHMHRPAEEFRCIARLLRPGGWLGIMTRFQTDDARFVDWHYRRDPTHVVFYREDTLRCIAARFGWTIEIPRTGVALLQKPGA
ncbi:MAG: class I SAM-dependent methyltransferase [Candidatus Wenzhouxiangella sp. M2_3B_020]